MFPFDTSYVSVAMNRTELWMVAYFVCCSFFVLFVSSVSVFQLHPTWRMDLDLLGWFCLLILVFSLFFSLFMYSWWLTCPHRHACLLICSFLSEVVFQMGLDPRLVSVRATKLIFFRTALTRCLISGIRMRMRMRRRIPTGEIFST